MAAGATAAGAPQDPTRSDGLPRHRVAHVTDAFLPRLGGIETHVDDLVRHQRAAGLRAEVLTPSRAGAAGDPPWVRRLSAASARRAVADYDVVHVHVSLFSPYGISAARAAGRAGVPVLVTVHSMWSGAGALLRLAALAGLRRWPVTWSAVSRAAGSTFARSFGGGVEIAVLPNAVDVDAWRPARGGDGRTASSDRSAAGTVTLVSVMRLVPRKRPLQLLRIVEQVRSLTGEDVRLVIVGDGPQRARVERGIRRRGLTGHVQVTGRLSRVGVRDELAVACVYVAPAPKESFGIAALEARCAGLPVVARRSSGIGDFIRDGADGFLVDGDAEMVAALAGLIRDRSLLDRIARHNAEHVPAFDWSDALERTARLYQLAAARLASDEVQATGRPPVLAVGA